MEAIAGKIVQQEQKKYSKLEHKQKPIHHVSIWTINPRVVLLIQKSHVCGHYWYFPRDGVDIEKGASIQTACSKARREAKGGRS